MKKLLNTKGAAPPVSEPSNPAIEAHGLNQFRADIRRDILYALAKVEVEEMKERIDKLERAVAGLIAAKRGGY